MAGPFSNHLAQETSPYLLQHAHNPVDWYPWGDEALQRAKNENLPILVSIGYSACHWCHVMERESFEDEETAAIMNRHFVNIKIDREERPDLDHIYMDAVQAMTGSGGWPLNVFLTPQGKPFYGGTYFPPAPGYNRPSWKQLLNNISSAFTEKREQIDAQSENLTDYLSKTNSFGLKEKGPSSNIYFDPAGVKQIYGQIMQGADSEHGGFGAAPKFPQAFVIQFLLHYYFYTGEQGALRQACLSLDKMTRGGLYDQIGGGFSRYSTDREWMVPHFEKMLYDNALLISALSDAYALTAEGRYLDRISETMECMSRQFKAPEGGFYAALDADSEGVEGKYYVWEKKEIDELLQEDSALFCAFYNVSQQGNWEGTNILHASLDFQDFARREQMDPETLKARLKDCRDKLLRRRSERIPPLTDDKILLGWNALMIIACCKAYAATGTEEYKQTAVQAMDFIWGHFRGSGLFHFYHCFKDGRPRFPAFLDDYAYLAAALIQLQEITGNTDYLQQAREVTEWTIAHFSEEAGVYFYFTHNEQQDIILRKKELYDGALPSGNAVMAQNLVYLSIIFDLPEWRERAKASIELLGEAIIGHPVSFGIWATLFQALTYSISEIVITGTEIQPLRKEFLSKFIPNRVYQSATSPTTEFPLLREKKVSLTPLIFLCKEYACQSPVTEVNELIKLLLIVQKNFDSLTQ